MEQENIIKLLYNFFNQGYDDGYESGYDGTYYEENDLSLRQFGYEDFHKWCEENWNTIVEEYSSNYFGILPKIKNTFDSFKKKGIIEKGIKQYISDKFNDSYGIEKVALELFLTRYIDTEYTVKKLQIFVDGFISYYDLDSGARESKVRDCLVETSQVLEKKGIDIKDLIGQYIKVNNLKTVVNISFYEALKITMQEIVDEIKDIFGEE